MFCCLRTCFNGELRTPVAAQRPREPDIQLDTANMGHEVVIVKNGKRLCGSGGALATAPLVQSKSYFEVKIQQSGMWAVGIATRQTDLNKTRGGSDKDSWTLCSDNTIRNNDQTLLTIKGIEQSTASIITDESLASVVTTEPMQHTCLPSEGDTIGVAYDHVELNFYLNGKNLEVPVLNIKGTVYPALYVDDGAILDIILDNFSFSPPAGFDKIMIEQSLL